MREFFFPFTVGFLGSLHCLSMCGPLVLAYSLQTRDTRDIAAGQARHPLPSGLLHHLAFHAGRLFTYGLLGALGAGLFQLTSFQQVFTGLRGGVTMAGGVFMVVDVASVAGLPAGDSLWVYHGDSWSGFSPHSADPDLSGFGPPRPGIYPPSPVARSFSIAAIRGKGPSRSARRFHALLSFLGHDR